MQPKLLIPAFAASFGISQACFNPLLVVNEPSDLNFPLDPGINKQFSLKKGRRTAITNVRVFDGYRIREPKTVIIDGDTVGHERGEVDAVIEGQGQILIPGLIDSHLHVGNVAALKSLTSYGVTTGINMACNSYQTCNLFKNEVGLATIFSAGIPAVAPSSAHARSLGLPSSLLIKSTEEISDFV